MCTRCFRPARHLPLILILIFGEQRTNYSDGELLSNTNVIARGKKKIIGVAWDKRLMVLLHAGYREQDISYCKSLDQLYPHFDHMLWKTNVAVTGISCIFIYSFLYTWVSLKRTGKMTLAHDKIKPHQEVETAVGKRRGSGSTNSVCFAFFEKRRKGNHFTGF